MTKGKYKAKAANRLANLDNEVLQEEKAKNVELRRQLADAQAQLQTERNERARYIIDRAAELAAEEIAAVRQGATEALERHQAEKEHVADMLSEYVRRMARENPDTTGPIPGNIVDILTALVGNKRVGAVLDKIMVGVPEWQHNRERRRLTGKEVNKRISFNADEDMREALVDGLQGAYSAVREVEANEQEA